MSSELEKLRQAVHDIWEASEKTTPLDPFPIHFEIVPAKVMYEIGAYGLPGRFSHWTHGKAFHQMKTMYDYGLSKIYELIINTNPAQAFLMEGNSLIQNKLVIAHVIGHSDFFKNNIYFHHTNRQMAETAGATAERIRTYEREHGEQEVEEFLDAVLAVQEHIDPNLRIKRQPRYDGKRRPEPRRRRGSDYDDLWLLREKDEAPIAPVGRKIPEEPEKDLLLFILEYAPELEEWQQDVLNIVREEMLYFLPQMQTKVMNEGWACATGESLLATERGFVRFRNLYEQREAIRVGSGGERRLHPITDFHREEQVPTLRITTRRGYTIEGALKHRVQLADGSWAFLSDLATGDRVALACGTDVWAAEPVPLEYEPAARDASLEDVARMAGTSIWTVIRHRAGRSTRSADRIDAALAAAGYEAGRTGKVLSSRRELAPPPVLNEPLAHLLGYFVGDGNLTKSGLCLTCGDEEYARKLADLVETTLGVPATLRADHTETGGRWRIEVHSRELLRLLERLGVDLHAKAPEKIVPKAVLRSPKPVVSAFLSGYFDADAYAGRHGVILSSASEELVRTVQVVLLNYGILSTQRPKPDGCTHLEIKGASAARFREQVGFKLERERRALDAYLDGHHWFKREDRTDEIVAIEPGEADVYDITVDVAHAYVANGFVNHNSYWHSRILREMDLTADEHIEFTRLHSSVLSPSPRGTSINPYYVGYRIFEDIERRWNGDLTEDELREYREQNHGEWPYRNQGREKMLEVRELDNDASFLRNYLTRQLVEDLDMYIYRKEGDEWVVVEKNWRKIRDSIVESMTNFGFPYLVVEDGDYQGKRQLYLRHCFDGREMDHNYASKTLRYVHKLWGRPVHLETVADEQIVVWSYDGETDSIEEKGPAELDES
jgi:stage V sporulation protein R